jgi:hypothetical protein
MGEELETMATTRRTFLRAMLATIALSTSTLTWADRPPTPEEPERIEAALRSASFRSWEEIEFDDRVWKVDDSRADDGRMYDLKFDPNTLQVIHKEED